VTIPFFQYIGDEWESKPFGAPPAPPIELPIARP